MNFALTYYKTDADSYLGQTTQLTSREQAHALRDGKIVAFCYTTGLMASSIKAAINTCDAMVLHWNDETQ